MNLFKLGQQAANAVVQSELPWRERVEVFAISPDKKVYGGKWLDDKSFATPGGGIDPGEDAAQAAVREYLEETGMNIINPRLASYGPVDNPWSDKYRQAKQRNFAGSRTHFVLADLAGQNENAGELDAWSAEDKRLYDLREALAMMRNKKFLAPAIAEVRKQILRDLLRQHRRRSN
jgi:8-oxo-dGTP pyrophosphatase MutT (NUDIX family)